MKSLHAWIVEPNIILLDLWNIYFNSPFLADKQSRKMVSRNLCRTLSYFHFWIFFISIKILCPLRTANSRGMLSDGIRIKENNLNIITPSNQNQTHNYNACKELGHNSLNTNRVSVHLFIRKYSYIIMYVTVNLKIFRYSIQYLDNV